MQALGSGGDVDIRGGQPETSAGRSVPGHLWRFADAEFDEARWQLRVGGGEVELEPRPLKVLQHLLRYAGEVVRKSELVEAVYGHQHVSDGALNQAVSKLRAALGDREQRLIVTVHRLGYRLDGPVQCELALDFRLEPIALAAGDSPPGREAWRLEAPLGTNHRVEVWLARHRKLALTRVFKLNVDGARLAGLKREVTLYRTLRQELGERPDFVSLLDWNFETPPYFIECEYGGEDLSRWFEAQGGAAAVSLETRLELLAQVAESIAAAHSVGVLHKDLKPRNVLVHAAADGAWHTRLTDFGSGHLLHSERLAQLGITRLGFTETAAEQGGSSAGTPQYMAPEVQSGGSATALADVYALGLMLYQLVVGDLRKPLAAGWERDIEDAVLREDIAATVDGDPQQRLASARELALRLRSLAPRREARQRQAQQQARMVAAARELERLRARRPWLITAVAALLCGFAVGGLFYADALESGRQAREQAQMARAVTDFFSQEVLSAASPYEALDTAEPITVHGALERALQRMGDRFLEQPLVEATIRSTIGEVLGELTDLPAALEQDRRALQLFREGLGAAHPRTLQAQYWLAQDLTEASQFEEAATLIAAADALCAEAGVTDLPTRFAAARAHCYHGILSSAFEAAVGACSDTLALQRELDPGDATALFKWQANLATLHSRRGRFDLAEPLFVEGLAALRADGADDSQTAARFRNLYGANLVAQQRYAEAEPLLQRAYESMVRRDPDNFYANETLGDLAAVYANTDRLSQAVAASRQSYEGLLRTAGAGHHYTATARGRLGVHQYAAGELEAGIANVEAARAAFVVLLGEAHPQAQQLGYVLAGWWLDAGTQLDEAEALIQQLQAEVLETAEPRGDWTPRLAELRARLLARRG